MTAVGEFSWRDGERTVHFGRGAVAGAVERLGGPGYTLLTTERAAATAAHVLEAARSVHHVGPGPVDHLGAELLDAVAGDRLVALGGGRVVDVAKALAAAGRAGLGAAARDARAMAIPTTLSGAEMTASSRPPRGVDPRSVPRLRPAVVINDPALSASQPPAELVASALNALGHAVEGPCATGANPVAALAADDAARRLVAALADRAAPDRDGVALGALLAGYAIDSTGIGLHHVLSQTLVREAGIGHGQANAAMLPHTLGALGRRRPERLTSLAAALGEDPVAAASRLARAAGASSLTALGVTRAQLEACAGAAAARPQLAVTPPAADRAEILALYEAAA